MAKPNYRFDKKQREIKKNQQQQDKLLKKQARKEAASADSTPVSPPSPEKLS